MADAGTVEFKGETINTEFIERLEKIIKEEWKVSNKSASKDTTHPTEYKDASGDAILIPADKKEEYELLRELIEILNFDLTNKNEIYRMPLCEIPKDMKEFEKTGPRNKKYEKEEISFYITKKGVNQIITKADKYENLLGIEFPQELYQLAKSTTHIPTPDTKFVAPEPQRYGETHQEYEDRMIKHYRDNGYEPTLKEDGRPPLPHEWVTYSDEIPKINPSAPLARPSYVEHLTELHLTPDMSVKNAPIGIKNGERKRIKSTRPGHHLLTSLRFGRKELKGKNLLKGLAGIGLGAFGISKFASIFGAGKIPAIIVAQAGVKLLIVAVIVILGYLAIKYRKRFFKAAKELLDRLIKGKKLEDGDLEHDGDDGDDGDDDGSDDSEGSEPETEPDVDIDIDLNAEGLFEEFQEGYRYIAELQSKIKIIEGEIEDLKVDKDKNKDLISQKIDEKNKMIVEQKRCWRLLYKTMAPYAEAARLAQENPGRGMGR